MLSRAFVWWPGLDQEVEEVCAKCEACVMHQNNPGPTATHAWEMASKPWERLHVDYAGPYLGRMFLVVADVYSKWLEVFDVSSATSSNTIAKLRVAFSTHGLPETLVSDNGTSFTSKEFGMFCKKNDIVHLTSAPYHPSSNGTAERTVQTFKKFMDKHENSTESIDCLVSRFLYSYRNTPHSRTGITPSELLMNRRPRTHLTPLKPDLNRKLRQRGTPELKVREFEVGDAVLARNYNGGGRWVKGVVSEKSGPVSYKIRINGGIIRRHVDQIVKSALHPETPHLSEEPQVDEILDDGSRPCVLNEEPNSGNLVDQRVEPTPLEASQPVIGDHSGACGESTEEFIPDENVEQPEPSLRRSTRIRNPPPKLKDYHPK